MGRRFKSGPAKQGMCKLLGGKCLIMVQEPEKASEKASEGAKPAAEAVNGKAEEDAPKGLPSLGPKPKKKAAAAPSEPAKQAEA